MEKSTADRLICEYTKKIYGFAISKTSSIERAEELASRITLEVYVSLLRQDNIQDIAAYIWRIAMNVRARFIDENSKASYFETDEFEMPDTEDFIEKIIESESYAKLRIEIAHLSKLRRKILILHYYKNMKLSDIAAELSIPQGTVKWHLSAARDELREGFTKMRTVGTLGIEPIELVNLGHDGRPGKFGATEYFLKNRLTQNIVWAAYKKPHTINEIADELGVNPIFLEDEIQTLNEYGFLDRIGERYLSNILIDDPTPESDIKITELYKKYAKELSALYAPRVIETLEKLDRSKMYIPDNDQNLLNWVGIAAALKNKLNASFDNAAYQKYMIPRKDGGCYIAFATVFKQYDLPFDMRLYSSCGPMIRGSVKYPVYSWQLTTCYDKRELNWQANKFEDYEYLYEFYTKKIGKEPENIEKYRRIRDKGYITENDEVNVICIKNDVDQYYKTDFYRLLPAPNETEKALMHELSEKICSICLDKYPEHMRPVAKLYNSSPSIAMYVIEELVEKNILIKPSELRAPGLCTLVFADKLPE